MDNKWNKYGLFTAICMVVGIVIGSGVFSRPDHPDQDQRHCPWASAWAVGGAMLVCLLTSVYGAEI